MRTITASEARQEFADVIEAARREPVIIQRQKRDVVVVMSVDEYERLVHLSVAEFQRFSDRVGAKAQEAGMTEDVLRELLTVRTDRKLVIDTNLWISRLLMPGGQAAKAVDHGLAWGLPLMSEDTRGMVDVLARPSSTATFLADRQQFIRLLGGIVRVIPIAAHHGRDPKDDKFLDVALNGDARMILTGDNDLLELHPFHGIEILKPADFLNRPAD